MDSRAEIQSDCDGHNEPVLISQVLSRVLHAKPVIMLMLDNTKCRKLNLLGLFWGLLPAQKLCCTGDAEPIQ
eukprot:s1584_g4.t1